jgi:hypothetical protein
MKSKDLDLADPIEVAHALATLAAAGHLGSVATDVMLAGSRTILKLIGAKPTPAPSNPDPPKRAV